MATQVASELERFHQFIAHKLSNGESDLSPEEALDEWRALNPTPEELAANVAALQRALAQADRGEGIPLDECIEQLRRKYNLPELLPEE